MINIGEFIKDFSSALKNYQHLQPWELTGKTQSIISEMIANLDDNYIIERDIAIHKTAVIETGAVMKGPILIGEKCFIGAHAYLRGGAWLAKNVRIGPGCEIKSSFIFSNTSIAHFNFIGDSIIGANANFEAGAVTANHHNDRQNKRIFVFYNSNTIDTGSEKFGSLVGDDCKIGANAVLSPGTVLKPGAIVKRLELVEQK